MDHHSFTPLILAAIGDHVDCVRVLLERGASENLPSGTMKINAIHWAAYKGSFKCLTFFLDNVRSRLHPQLFVEYFKRQDLYGNTLLHNASKSDSKACINLLLDLQSDIEQRNSSGFTSLLIAAQSGELEAVKALVERGARINAICQDGFAPLHYAAQGGWPDIVRYLIANGANIDQPTHTGWTPLMMAANNNYGECVKILLDANANPFSMNNNGEKTLQLSSPACRAMIEAAIERKFLSRSFPREKTHKKPLFLRYDEEWYLTPRRHPGVKYP